MCMYTHMYIYIYVYIYLHVYIIYIYTYIFTYLCVYMHSHTFLHAHDIYIIYHTYKEYMSEIFAVSNIYTRMYIHSDTKTHNRHTDDTGQRRTIRCLELQAIFPKRATNYRALLRKMTCEDKASSDSTPPCMYMFTFAYKMYIHKRSTISFAYIHIYTNIHICTPHLKYI